MTTQTKQLVEAAKSVINRNQPVDQIYRNLDKLQEAIIAYEQSTEQQEAIAGEKSALEIWKEWCEKDISWTDAASGAMSEYASQQTALKDKQLQVQQSHIDDQDQLIFEQDKEIKELKAELEKVDYAYKNIEKRYNNAVSEVERLEVIKWINVEERLPECDGIFLVCTIAGDVDMIEFNNGAFGVEHQNIFIPARQGLITHWQPLPQPTK